MLLLLGFIPLLIYIFYSNGMGRKYFSWTRAFKNSLEQLWFFIIGVGALVGVIGIFGVLVSLINLFPSLN